MSEEHAFPISSPSISSETAYHPDNLIEEQRARRTFELIKQLRDEAYDVRDCFTRYSVQGIAVAIFGLGAILKLNAEPGQDLLGLLSSLIIILMFTIARMGTHKYATSDRLLGYELYLQRLPRYPATEGAAHHMYEVGWEEVMNAWRIVQATLFERIYGAAKFHRLERAVSNGEWFKPENLANKHNARYHPGGYLRDMLYVAFAIITFCVAVVLHSTYGIVVSAHWDVHIRVFTGIFAAGLLYFSWFRSVRIYGRLRNLEKELLSIYSCSIVWELTVVAHLLALRDAQALAQQRAPHAPHEFYSSYLERLAMIAAEIAANHEHIHRWLRESRAQLSPQASPQPMAA